MGTRSILRCAIMAKASDGRIAGTISEVYISVVSLATSCAL